MTERPSGLSYSVVLQGDAVLRLEGELDLSGEQLLALAVDEVAGAGTPRTIIDLRDVSFIDSSGLRFLLDAKERLSGNGRSVAFVRGPERVQMLFELTGLDRRLDFIDPE